MADHAATQRLRNGRVADVAYTTNTLTCLAYAAALVFWAWLRAPLVAADPLAAEWTWGLVAVAGLSGCASGYYAAAYTPADYYYYYGYYPYGYYPYGYYPPTPAYYVPPAPVYSYRRCWYPQYGGYYAC